MLLVRSLCVVLYSIWTKILFQFHKQILWHGYPFAAHDIHHTLKAASTSNTQRSSESEYTCMQLQELNIQTSCQK